MKSNKPENVSAPVNTTIIKLYAITDLTREELDKILEITAQHTELFLKISGSIKIYTKEEKNA